MTVSIPNSVRLVSKSGPVYLFLSSSREEASLVTTSDTEDAVHSGIDQGTWLLEKCHSSSQVERFITQLTRKA